MARKAVTNEKNTRDSNTRAGKVVLDKHKAKMPKKAVRMKNMRTN